MVVQLTVRDANGNSIVPQDELPFLIMHLSLFTKNGIAPLDMGSSVTGQPPPILYGSLVSSVNHLEDHNGKHGPVLSLSRRQHPLARPLQLGVTLLRISRPDFPGITEQGTTLAQARTNSFEAFPHDEYIAARLCLFILLVAPLSYPAAAQTRLTQAFLRQGARMLSLNP
ncbi:hypothetical protein B0H14DRAFT_3148275 [Mycena olivaceomarginata]|nr:hypothetical protein B0H14DRAFT_3148275 [Mycena olivaceomarginata]